MSVVAKLSDLKVAGVLPVQIGRKMVALFWLDGEVVAYEDLCPHRAGPLSEGEMKNGEVTCPWHQARFELKTGKVLCGPATRSLKRVPVKVDGDSIIGLEVAGDER